MYDTIIIGAGIAGLTSAIYASRKKMNFEIIASEFGGQFMASGEILNYPGIIETTGAEFSSIMKKQAEFNNINVKSENVVTINNKGDCFEIRTDKNYYRTLTIIIATGAKPRRLDVPGEKEFSNKGITYCSICDGPLFKDKHVAVIGGGNSALEAVDFLSDIVSKISLIVKGEKFTGHEYLIERVMDNDKIDIYFNTDTKEIKGDKFVNAVSVIQNSTTNTDIDVEGVIVEIGRTPNTEIFKDFVDLDEHGHIIIDCQTKTSVPGVFAAGDCAAGHEYQYVIAAGQGCMALIKAARYLYNKKE